MKLDHELFAVTGMPVLHSLSPYLFRAGFDALGLQNQYLRLSARSASDALVVASQMKMRGVNVTSPYKEQMARLVECHDEASKTLQAVNTLVRDEDGWLGYNTDPQGVVGALRHHGFEISGARVLVLGAGGAGRAAAYGLVDSGARVSIVNRTAEKARLWADRLGCDQVDLDDMENSIQDADLLVSCLPGGVQLFDPKILNPSLLVLEADYSQGWLSRCASDAGCEIIDGRQWLIHQALAGFSIMVRRKVSLSGLMGSAPPSKNTLNNVILIGFMGSGKSSVGRVLARELEVDFTDTDDVVERRAGMSIDGIFQSRGEADFRTMEHNVLGDVLRRGPQVVACGGGAILLEQNRELVESAGIVVWLWAPLDECLQRAAVGTRPLLKGAFLKGHGVDIQARKLFEMRLPLYAGCSDLVVPSLGPDPKEISRIVAHEIRCIWKN